MRETQPTIKLTRSFDGEMQMKISFQQPNHLQHQVSFDTRFIMDCASMERYIDGWLYMKEGLSVSVIEL